MGKLYFAILYIGISFIVLYYLIRSFSHREELAKRMRYFLFFGWLVIVSYSITLFSNTEIINSIGHSLVFICIDYLLFNLVEYSIEYNKSKIIFKNIKIFFEFFILIDTIIFLFNPWTNFAISYSPFFLNNELYLIYHPKLWFDIHLLACYGMILIFILAFADKAYHTPKEYRIKYTMHLLLILSIVLINAFFLLFKFYIDFSIVTYGLAAIGIYFFTYEFTPTKVIYNANALIVENMRSGVLLFDFEQKLVTANPIAMEICNLTSSDFEHLYLDDFLKQNALSFDVSNPKHQSIEITRDENNNPKWYQIGFQNMYDSSKKYLGSLVLLYDNTDHYLNIQQLEYMANHDFLTKLYNRSYYLSIQDTITSQANYPISYVCWNINGLKTINNIYGNANGDIAVKSVADTISQEVGDKGHVFRFDGDEIIVILYNTLEEETLTLMRSIRKRIEAIYIHDIQVTAEFGMAILTDASDTLDQAYTKAKRSMTHKKMLNQKSLRSNIIESLKKSLQENNYDTEEHAERTSSMAVQLGKKLNLNDSSLKELELLAMLHDIGKLSIPDYILNKPSKLTNEEFEIMKTHTVKGFEIARITPELSNIAEYILHHHERWDGRGYPNGLRGEEIPLLSRIISIVDSHDVMTHDRVYHKAMSQEEAIKELQRCSGTQFDPNIVSIFLELLTTKTESC